VKPLASKRVNLTMPSPLSRRDLDEVYSCRIALEGIAAAEASQRRKPDDVKRLQDIFSQLRRAFPKTDIPAYFEPMSRSPTPSMTLQIT
jgi:DNA-binding GntR family transcriptional regulator